MTKPVIGFIGVGLMGHGMAKNIVEKGYPLIVMGHRNRKPVENLISLGAKEAASARELAQACDILHICVTGTPQVEALVRGPEGILASGKAGLTVIDCSTSDPVSTLQLAQEFSQAGMHFADAPLSRTPKEAELGTLDTMVGADEETFARIKPVLECWAGVINHLGEVGLGHKMKLINNFIAMGYASLYSEALAIARKSGLSPEQVNAVIAPSRMANGFYETFMKWTLEQDENAHKFSISNAHKDMRYLSSMANAAGALNPMQAVIKNNFAAMEAIGEGDRYVPMLADFVAAQSGLTLSADKND
ncbi:NAD(P)-dependent oxidoreductase [Roseibium sp. CAU 1637]|uniref:NAD(P)-dependent oxidoreductase n=1 Tax=Roseibium limicola TaxID=2816037 RepID=A0A939EJY0_9HYPH|nr:NAD(P)-dependent oxidoreductase [Roseibium limicola]MBO0343858.1 NAD(P)-dependent oxidoreductase [Roseibium limicola]